MAILEIGQFQQTSSVSYIRRITDTQAVIAVFYDDRLAISMQPAISHWDHHFGRREQMGVYFEIAAKYAEQVAGQIMQQANIQQCRANPSDVSSDLVVAQYPELPLSFEHVCAGFQAVLSGE